MYSAAARSARPLAVFLLLIAGLAGAGALRAQPVQPPPETPEAWLVTYGPGDIYWQRFGHNAIWLREPGGLDHTFNFGFFDFEQESFLLRFVQGRMLYFAAAVPAQQEIALYRGEGREVRLQRLDLPPGAYARLREHLLWHVRPENREYLYDYYLDNCSTRLRDALDLALDGQLAARFGNEPAGQTFRSHTRRSTQADRDYYLGLVTALGLPVDRPVSRWDEMFLPAVLADAVRDLEIEGVAGPVPLVSAEQTLVPGVVTPPPPVPGRTWPFFGLIGTALAVLGLLLARLGPVAGVEGAALAWLLITGTLGLGLVLIWAFTDHVMAYPNFNLLLLNPLWVLGVVPALRRFTAVLVALGAGTAVLVASWPGGQYLADTLALLLPVNLAVAWRLWRCPAPPRRARRRFSD